MGSFFSLVILLALTALAPKSLAASPEGANIRAKISLYPIGGFEVTSEVLDGIGQRIGNAFSASELRVATKTLKSGMALRDQHLRERLKADEFPDITATNISAKDGSGTATLSIRGIKKLVDFKYKILSPSLAEATFALKLSDFDIKEINYKGVGVEDEVEVLVTVPYEGK
jgi:hypothetical protein